MSFVSVRPRKKEKNVISKVELRMRKVIVRLRPSMVRAALQVSASSATISFANAAAPGTLLPPLLAVLLQLSEIVRVGRVRLVRLVPRHGVLGRTEGLGQVDERLPLERLQKADIHFFGVRGKNS